MQNAEIFSANTLLVILGTSLLTARVGMSIDPKLLVSNFPVIMGSLGLLIVGKTALVAVVGRLFGVSWISAIRTGLLLAPGGEFAFVAFGEAVNQGIMAVQVTVVVMVEGGGG
ncbi:putative cation/H+ exchanger, sodium/solute symporter superfamily [Helianthus annuus]|nr:putative cation/H+ exchanger, sodium/solute symporter superfamily [Helianthus annuus]KAJ0737391.1 putative cation/H+ exchanger, sodium/solute symporter superfamily [Helianthus annuus]